jgi:hypothetical protein
VFGVRTKQTSKFSTPSAPLREKKTNKLSPRRKARKDVKGKYQTNIEVLGGLGAFARKKQISSRQGAKHAKVFGISTK